MPPRLRLRLSSPHAPRAARPAFMVDPEGDWKSCTATIPKDCTVIGTVTSEGVTGALVRLHGSGNYVKVVNGRVAIVNAIKVQQALVAYRNREMQSSLEMVPVDELGE